MKRALVVVAIVLGFVAIAWAIIHMPPSPCGQAICPPPD